MPLEQQKRFVAPGEHVRMTAEDLRDDPKVKIVYPSGFAETLDWDSFEIKARVYLGLTDWRTRTQTLAYLSNFKKTVFYPNENIHRIRMTLPDGTERYV